CQQGYGVLTF
nr:immunoglobulin light chain junction region [Macaca mulatta]